jgi:hypothetical protein
MTQDHYPGYISCYVINPVTSHMHRYRSPMTGYITGTSLRHHRTLDETTVDRSEVQRAVWTAVDQPSIERKSILH